MRRTWKDMEDMYCLMQRTQGCRAHEKSPWYQGFIHLHPNISEQFLFAFGFEAIARRLEAIAST